MTKEDILAEIRRTATENGGNPLGIGRFEQVTGIRPYDWGRHWAWFGDAIRDAGLEPNTLNAPYSDIFLLQRLVELIREIGKFPTDPELRLKGRADEGFPNSKTFRRFGNKNQMIGAVLAYAQGDPDPRDIVELCEMLHQPPGGSDHREHAARGDASRFGFVYLVKGHPGECKIGRTTLVDRRLPELGVSASIEPELIHEIKTDDPVGVEAYWHRRFKDKQMRGEWFRLRADDVAAFRRWRKIS